MTPDSLYGKYLARAEAAFTQYALHTGNRAAYRRIVAWQLERMLTQGAAATPATAFNALLAQAGTRRAASGMGEREGAQ